jgi:hypothetical protein
MKVNSEILFAAPINLSTFASVIPLMSINCFFVCISTDATVCNPCSYNNTCDSETRMEYSQHEWNGIGYIHCAYNPLSMTRLSQHV